MNFFLIAVQALLMNWFISKIVFQISSENTAHKPQFDEQLRLIAADNAEEAFMKARKIGLDEEDCFLNDHNNQVRWEFINVAEVVPVSSIQNGVELFSAIHETENAKEYIRCIHEKAIFIRKNYSASVLTEAC
jgi:hypothetical protein